MKTITKLALILLAFFAALNSVEATPQTPAPAPAQTAAAPAKFGDYPAISSPLYDSWVRTSQYVKMRDGVRLAIDILRPALKGAVEKKPLPALWTHTRYRRASIVDGKIQSSLQAPHLLAMLKRGYVLAAVDVRGSGASFGVFQGIFTPAESQDAYEITEWLARQPWCDGKIGMFGGSYLGITQLMAAGTRPPHLKAIVPMVALFDLFDTGAGGGIFREDFVRTWSFLTRFLDSTPGVAPVDEDKEGRLLKAAMEEHKQNRLLLDIVSPLRFRNSPDEMTGEIPNLQWHPAAVIDRINAGGIPTYIWAGWFDSFTRDGFLLWRNLTVPKRLTIGAWSHSPKDKEISREEFVLLTIESLRWYDHWLKGIDTGIAAEDHVFFQVMKGPKDNTWASAKDWPLAETRPTDLFFGAGKTGSAASANDGGLKLLAPRSSGGADSIKIDYTATSGETSRWDNAVGGGFGYPDMAANDKKGLTYTTPPLTEAVEVTGHPVARVWMSSTAKDADLFVYLEEVDAKGVSTYVSEGSLRASARAIGKAPYDNMGLPYHRVYAEDIKELIPGEPAELVIELLPTSNVFDAGNRLRLTITGADKDNAATPVLDPPPTLTVYRSKERPSSLSLPVMGTVKMPEIRRALPLFFFLTVGFVVIALVIVFTMYVRKRTAKA